MENLMTPQTLFLVKFISLNSAFIIFMMCIMHMCKKMYKSIPLFSILLLAAFITYAFTLLKII